MLHYSCCSTYQALHVSVTCSIRRQCPNSRRACPKRIRPRKQIKREIKPVGQYWQVPAHHTQPATAVTHHHQQYPQASSASNACSKRTLAPCTWFFYILQNTKPYWLAVRTWFSTSISVWACVIIFSCRLLLGIQKGCCVMSRMGPMVSSY